MLRWIRRTGAAAVATAAMLAVALPAQPAVAVSVPNGSVVPASVTRITPADTWRLASTETGPVAAGQETRFGQYATAVENGGIPKTGLSTVLADLNATGRALCHDTNAAGAQGFCWDDTWGDDSGMTYVPQGVTGSGAARGNELLTGGRRIVVTSWHSGEKHPAGEDNLMRVTFADVTDPVVRYRHVLLVTPTATGYTALRGHADSVTWYGKYLYVSNAGGLAVFDLTRIWRTDENSGSVGASGGTYSAAWHKYALPQIDRYQYVAPTPPGYCGTFNGYPPCFAGVSVDDSGSVPALVTTEKNGVMDRQQQQFTDPGVIARWPLDKTTGLLLTDPGTRNTRASEAFRSTVSGAQGVAMDRGRFVVSAPCPEFVAGGANIPSCLYHAWEGEPVRLWTRTGINNQNVSYWPATDELWTINEYPGDRTVFHIPWPKPAVPVRSLTGTFGDLTGDTLPELLAVRPQAVPENGGASGELVLYPGTPQGPGTRASIGSGWDTIRLLAGVGDLTGDGKPDVLAVDTAGDLYLYPGAAGGLGARQKLSSGWGVVQAMTGVGDLTGDGLPDLMAVWNDGTAHLYPGKAGGLGTRAQIGTNWNSMRLLTGTAGDLTGDGRPDVLAVDGAGDLYLYPGAASGLGVRQKLSGGWGVVQAMAGVGDLTGDGLPDLMAVWNDGTAHLYPGKAGGLGTSTPVDLGWGTGQA
ncbi:VCBS repeat-containing protein [Streptomyces sp. Ru72]|uniref:FG-GAP repeat domain-containing protein n=1 Tax=Streptomyces sp. Ru72 TaxID=2080747 RepID=UPI000CDDE3F9|nr:VCBS repeat-containing protein [Streptomyces sp. Ru72]POX40453.1 hypothetical protein C3488_38585 [Streptomyces sp. Ru72]